MQYKDFFQAGLKSDKIQHHGYHRIYPWFLNNFLHIEKVNILEIGVDEQNSIHLWIDFFKDSEVTVMDIDDKNVENVKFVKLDQSSKNELENYAINNLNSHHLIIDDGSHVPEHQMMTLVHLWKTLKPGGVYIVEDVETSYWGRSSIYGYNFNSNNNSFVSRVIKKVEKVNSEFYHSKEKRTKDRLFNELMNEVEIVSFAYNCIILVKKNNEFAEYYNRNYRNKNYINKNRNIRFLLRSILTFLKKR
jgi:hypothetical protein